LPARLSGSAAETVRLSPDSGQIEIDITVELKSIPFA
jgi:hypothetical protein